MTGTGALAASWPGILAHGFFRNAAAAGALTAVAAGLAGWFVVTRNQVFAADALSHVALTGGVGALAYGLGAGVGVYGGTVVLAVVLGLAGSRAARAGDTVTGIVFAWVLGLGAYFLSVLTGGGAGGDGAAAVRVLFGSVFGISGGQIRATAWVAAVTIGGLLLVARPLLFSTVDPDVARSQGVPVRFVEVAFLALLGLAVAQAVQVLGTLLVLALMATPAAIARHLTDRPWTGMWLSSALAVTAVWAGLVISYIRSDLPPSFVIVSLLVVAYLVAGLRVPNAVAGLRGPKAVAGLLSPRSGRSDR
ncbi:MAG: metal ABC transporter permease [Acidimicrobiales bacterium]